MLLLFSMTFSLPSKLVNSNFFIKLSEKSNYINKCQFLKIFYQTTNLNLKNKFTILQNKKNHLSNSEKKNS